MSSDGNSVETGMNRREKRAPNERRRRSSKTWADVRGAPNSARAWHRRAADARCANAACGRRTNCAGLRKGERGFERGRRSTTRQRCAPRESTRRLTRGNPSRPFHANNGKCVGRFTTAATLRSRRAQLSPGRRVRVVARGIRSNGEPRCENPSCEYPSCESPSRKNPSIENFGGTQQAAAAEDQSAGTSPQQVSLQGNRTTGCRDNDAASRRESGGLVT